MTSLLSSGLLRRGFLRAIAFMIASAPAFSVALRAAAAPPANNEEIVELPKFVVTDSHELPPPEKWRYAEVPGFEILSNASDHATVALIHDFLRFHEALGIVWPVERPSSVPTSLIVCGAKDKFDEFKPDEQRYDTATASLFLKDEEQTAIVLDLQASVIDINTMGSATGSALPMLPGGTSVEVPVSGFSVNQSRQLDREYIRFLLSQAKPRPAAWFEEGLAQIFMDMSVDKKSITVGQLEDPGAVTIEQANTINNNLDAMRHQENKNDQVVATYSAPEEDRDFNTMVGHSAASPKLPLGAQVPQLPVSGLPLMDLQKMFDVARGSETANANLGSLWAKQCQAFVHLCLYGEGKKYQKAFVAFVTRSAAEPATEKIFKECFGMSYKDMLLELRSYSQFTAYQAAQFNAKKGMELPDPPPIELRDATEAEVGRLKGDTLRLAGHLDRAHFNLIAPYVRGERDPRLLGALGLQELASHENARAMKFLDAASAAKVVRPRVYLALARLRYDAALAAPRGAGSQLDTPQAVEILRPLFTARAQRPPMPEVYELIAATWTHCAAPLTRENLGVLFEGVRLFPSRTTLVYDTAQLSAKTGLTTEAGLLANLGLDITTDATMKGRFVQLKASLPPAPAKASAPPAKSG